MSFPPTIDPALVAVAAYHDGLERGYGRVTAMRRAFEAAGVDDRNDLDAANRAAEISAALSDALDELGVDAPVIAVVTP